MLLVWKLLAGEEVTMEDVRSIDQLEVNRLNRLKKVAEAEEKQQGEGKREMNHEGGGVGSPYDDRREVRR